jgi:hypothetical protein
LQQFQPRAGPNGRRRHQPISRRTRGIAGDGPAGLQSAKRSMLTADGGRGCSTGTRRRKSRRGQATKAAALTG